MTYVELHAHSAYSFLDGASLPDELAPTALELGYQALALTDHNTVSGSMEFAVAARALGLRPIHGAEVDLSDGRHLTLLVQDAHGWSNLCRILTLAHAHTREKPGPPSPAHVPLDAVLEQIQNELFNLGSDLATLPQDRHPKQPVIEARHVSFLEKTIDDLNAGLPELKSFVLPGGGWVSSFLHQARTVCRRAERLVTTLARREAVGAHALVYLNRLSDLLFVLGRWAAKTRREPEPLWNPTKS